MGYLSTCLLAVILIVCLNTIIGRDNTKAYFPDSNPSKFPRLRMVGTLPDLHDFTFCSWIRIYNITKGKHPFIFSYATTSSDNEMAILLHTLQSYTGCRVHIGAPLVDFDCSVLDTNWDSWNHICVTWFSPSGKVEVFINSLKRTPTSNSSISTGSLVRSGGVAIIGQDQDAVDSKFDPNQGWHGDLADIQVWDEVLTTKQIEEAGKCGGKRRVGNVIGWLKTPMAAIDGIVFAETQLCDY